MPVRTMLVDIDNTIIDDNGVVFPGVREKLTQWRRNDKYVLIAMSHTGGEYARRVLEDNDLLEFFMRELKVYQPREKKWIMAQVVLCFDKPDVITDDSPHLLLDLAAKLRPPPLVGPIDDYTWWKQTDAELFRNSRNER